MRMISCQPDWFDYFRRRVSWLAFWDHTSICGGHFCPLPAVVIIPNEILLWAPPSLGPLTFLLVAVLGISAAGKRIRRVRVYCGYWGTAQFKCRFPKHAPLFTDRPVYSGNRTLQRAGSCPHQFCKSVVVAANLQRRVCHHRRRGDGLRSKPTTGDLWTYAFSLGLLMAVGVIGAVLHVNTNITGQGAIILERFLRGAPFLAPLLFANMGLLGFLVLLED